MKKSIIQVLLGVIVGSIGSFAVARLDMGDRMARIEEQIKAINLNIELIMVADGLKPLPPYRTP